MFYLLLYINVFSLLEFCRLHTWCYFSVKTTEKLDVMMLTVTCLRHDWLTEKNSTQNKAYPITRFKYKTSSVTYDTLTLPFRLP